MRCSLIAVAVGSLFLFGCGSSPSNLSAKSVLTKGLTLPPGTNAIVAVKSTAGVSVASPSSKSLAPRSQLTPTITIDSAMIVLKEVTLYLPEDGNDDGAEEEEDEGTKIKLEGPFLVDLVAETVQNLGTSNIDDDADDDGIDDLHDDDDDGDGTADDDDDDDDGDGIADADDQTVGETQVVDALVLPPGTYRRIKFKLDDLDADDAPSPDHPMIGLSVLVTGSVDDVPFEFCHNLNTRFQFRSQTGIVVEEGSLSTFLLTIDPLGWFATLDPSAGTLSEDGVLRICGNDNPDLADIVVHAIKDNARLGRDDDGDGNDDDDAHDDDGSADEGDNDSTDQ